MEFEIMIIANADIILASLFSIYRKPLTLEQIKGFIHYINTYPYSYIADDFTESDVIGLSKEYPEYYILGCDENGNKTVIPGNRCPNPYDWEYRLVSETARKTMKDMAKSYIRKLGLEEAE